jgi:hypothetical protein
MKYAGFVLLEIQKEISEKYFNKKCSTLGKNFTSFIPQYLLY